MKHLLLAATLSLIVSAAFACETGLRPVINSLLQARIWQEANGGLCHLMVDTGINRLGISPQEAGDAAIRQLEVVGLFSHLACADEDSAMNAEQLQAFFNDDAVQLLAGQLRHHTIKGF